jgi:hypothetical protein
MTSAFLEHAVGRAPWALGFEGNDVVLHAIERF